MPSPALNRELLLFRLDAPSVDPGVPPAGFDYLVDENGNYIVDENGSYIIVPQG
jgi:hypothetical protein